MPDYPRQTPIQCCYALLSNGCLANTAVLPDFVSSTQYFIWDFSCWSDCFVDLHSCPHPDIRPEFVSLIWRSPPILSAALAPCRYRSALHPARGAALPRLISLSPLFSSNPSFFNAWSAWSQMVPSFNPPKGRSSLKCLLIETP